MLGGDHLLAPIVYLERNMVVVIPSHTVARAWTSSADLRPFHQFQKLNRIFNYQINLSRKFSQSNLTNTARHSDKTTNWNGQADSDQCKSNGKNITKLERKVGGGRCPRFVLLFAFAKPQSVRDCEG